MRQAKLGPDHPSTLTSKSNLASFYRQAGQYQKSLELEQNVLEMMQRKRGIDHPQTLTLMSNMAASYKLLDQIDKAVELNQKVLELRKKKLGSNHPDTLFSMSNLAALYVHAGEFEKALAANQEVFALQKIEIGHDHPDALRTLSNLANSYSKLGQTDKAIELNREALELRRTKLGSDHPETLVSISNLAATYSLAKQTDKAIQLNEEVLQLRKTKLGADHPDTLKSMSDLGVSYKDADRIDEAIELLEAAFESSKGATARHSIESKLRDAYVNGKRIEKLEKLIQRSILETRKQTDQEGLRNQLNECGSALFKAGSFSKAEVLLRECFDLLSEEDPNAWRTFETMSLLGASVLEQGRYEEAKPILTSSLQGLKTHANEIPASQRKSQFARIITWLIELAEAEENEKDLEKWNAARKELEVTHSESDED